MLITKPWTLVILFAAATLACSGPPESTPLAGDGAPDRGETPVVKEIESLHPPRTHEVTAIVGATVFDATGRDPIVTGTVVLKRDRIVAVGPSSDIEVPTGAHVVDAAGKWVVPGLIDAHIHFFQSAGIYTRPDVVDLREVRPYGNEMDGIKTRLDDTFRRWLVSGVTSVVDMGGPFWNYEVRRVAGETLIAPRVAVAGPLVSTVPRPQLDVGDPPIIEAAAPDDARALVRKQLDARTDLTKVWFIVSPEKGVDATIDMLRAVVDESHKGGVRVAVHATELESAMAAVSAGADILVHSIHDEAVDDALIAIMKERGTILIPTLYVMKGYAQVLGGATSPTDFERKYGDPVAMTSWDELAAASGKPPEQAASRRMKYEERAPVMAANLARLRAAGITIAAGTDAGNIGTLHGPGLHTELELMVEAGMSPADVLISATRDAAKVFSEEPEVGTVEVGKLADLLILDADPLDDVANLQRIHGVVKGGAVMTPREIMAPNPAWVVQAQVDAYNARDIDGFASWFADDVVVRRHPSGEIVMEGGVELRKKYAALFEKSPNLECRITSRAVHGAWVVDHELVSGMANRPYTRAVAIYRVDGGLIREVWFLPER